jgi:hypothetical protein
MTAADLLTEPEADTDRASAAPSPGRRWSSGSAAASSATTRS